MDYPVIVQCYEGMKAKQAPRSFVYRDRTLRVREVFRQWLEEDLAGRDSRRKVFDVLCDDGDFYRLTYRFKEDAWFMSPGPDLTKGI